MGSAGVTNDGTGCTGHKLHIFFFPVMAPGHMIPMIDMAKLFTARGVKSTLLTTAYHEPLILRSIGRTQKLGFDVSVVTLRLPLQEVWTCRCSFSSVLSILCYKALTSSCN